VLKALGGGEAVAAWTLEALKDQYDLTVLTWEAADARELNRVFGTSLTAADFKVLSPSPLTRSALDRLVAWNDTHHFQRICWLYRLMQQKKNDFDIVMSTHDEVDFGRPGIQYIHYPTFRSAYESEQRTAAHAPGQPTFNHWWKTLRQRLRPWRLISGISFARVKQNFTLVNSDWTGKVVREMYDIPSHTVYPPVAGDFPDVPWDKRQNRFVCIGRFVPHKRIEMVIEMLAAVRAQGNDVRLHLIGLFWDDMEGRAYYQTVKRLVHEHAPWVSLSENIERDKLVQLVSESRYGIHAADVEPFGIAPAEMVQAGCITFTGREGGQAEIVGKDERLIFDSVADGAAKILKVLRSPQQQFALREHLATRRMLFTAQEFVRRIRETVGQFEAVQLQ